MLNTLILKHFSTIAHADTAAPPQNPMFQFLPLVVVFVIFYFIIIIKQKKKI
jgi:preprotein translocase subunit YajC